MFHHSILHHILCPAPLIPSFGGLQILLRGMKPHPQIFPHCFRIFKDLLVVDGQQFLAIPEEKKFPKKNLWEKSERKEKLSLYFATLTSFSYLNQMNVDKAKERFASSISTFFQCLVNSVARKLLNTSDLEL